MKMLPNVIKQLKRKSEGYYYKRKYFELKKEFDTFRVSVNRDLKEIEQVLKGRVKELEGKIRDLEEYRRQTEGAVRVIGSLEPERRKN